MAPQTQKDIRFYVQKNMQQMHSLKKNAQDTWAAMLNALAINKRLPYVQSTNKRMYATCYGSVNGDWKAANLPCFLSIIFFIITNSQIFQLLKQIA